MHWVHATAFLVLLATGLCLYLPSLAEPVGRRPLLKAIHIYTAVGLARSRSSLVVVARRPARPAADGARDRPLRRRRPRVAPRTARAPQGRLNAGQKLNAIVTAAFALLFAITGFFLWYGERDTRFRLPNALLVHDWLMYVVVLPVPRPPVPVA